MNVRLAARRYYRADANQEQNNTYWTGQTNLHSESEQLLSFIDRIKHYKLPKRTFDKNGNEIYERIRKSVAPVNDSMTERSYSVFDR